MAGIGIPDTLKGRSLTRISAWSADELALALDLARELKVERSRRKELRLLPGRTVGLIFRKPSTRTRWAGFSSGQPRSESVPMVNSPPGTQVMPGGAAGGAFHNFVPANAAANATRASAVNAATRFMTDPREA